MSNFDFMSFGYEAGDVDTFVAHAKKYTAAETIELCKREFDYFFQDRRIAGKEFKALRTPTIKDIQSAYCAFRLGVEPEWPDGCYTLLNDKERGSFPVWLIDFSILRSAHVT